MVQEEEPIGLNALVLGPVIAKGCSAVVYAARKKEGKQVIPLINHVKTKVKKYR